MTSPMPAEAAIDPDLPVIDTHHHLFDRGSEVVVHVTRRSRYLIDDYLEGLGGHNVIATVAVEAHSMYRSDGPVALRPVGETEFLNGQAAMAASGAYGRCRVLAGIVSYADLRIGDGAREVLEAHVAAAPRRFVGIRQAALWDEDPTILGDMFGVGAQLYARDDFRRGFACLAALGLSFDAFCLAPQLPDIADLARAFPTTSIVLDHVGNPVGIGRHQGRLEAAYEQWRTDMAEIAACSNVTVKLGGLGTFLTSLPSFLASPPFSSEQLADEWRPWIAEAIELFGPDRAMFESNLPTDGAGTFGTVCNAFKRLTADLAPADRQAIFAGTATRVYRLEDNLPRA
jgi:L-fuconolactonase